MVKSLQKKSVRFMAVEILSRVENDQAYAEPLLDAYLNRISSDKNNDKRLLTNIVYGTLRMQGRIDWIIRQLYRGNFDSIHTSIKNTIRTSLFQLLFTDRIPAFAIVNEAVEIAKIFSPRVHRLVNGILRNYIRKKDQITYPDMKAEPAEYISFFYSHPLFLVRQWIEKYGIEETISICQANNQIPPFTLRINRLKTSRSIVIEEMAKSRIKAEPTLFSPDGIILSDIAVPIKETDFYKKGFVQVQDEASQMIGYLVDPMPGDKILDLCAGNGGKTTHLAEIMENKGRIVANDIDERKIAHLQENLQRMGITIVETKNFDAELDMGKSFHEQFDKVLIDAPCSGTGTLRRNPEIKWRISGDTVLQNVSLQKKLLKKAAYYVKNNGYLIYSTCSDQSEENEKIVSEFLSCHRQFALTAPSLRVNPFMIDKDGCFRTFPHRHGMDGFFGAVLLKKEE